MPTIDTETFQFLTVALLGFVALLGLIALLMLGGIKKALKKRPVAALEVTAHHPDDVRAVDGDAAAAQRQAEEAAARAQTQRALQQQQEEEARRAQQAAQATQPQAAATGDPQEQPYERDGRWWFRRGDELLVYDERSGQWHPAPQATPAAGAPAPGGTATMTEQPAEEGGFWKCPTCGAVNGSTMTSCRMCFTQRP